MPRALINLLAKEIKELMRDPKILVGTVLMPVIMFGLLGSIFSTSISSTQEAVKNLSVIVVDEDKGEVSSYFKSFLMGSPEFKFKTYYSDSLDDALQKAPEYNISGVVLLPKGLSENISKGVHGQIMAYVTFNALSLVEQGKASIFQSIVDAFNKVLSLQIIASSVPSKDPTFVSNPISGGYYTYFKGKVLDVSPQMIYGTLSTQIMMMPIVIMIMLFTTMSMAATAVAIEKETKTLETLLTLPVNRITILVGKLSGSLFVAVLGTITYIIGFNYYMSSLTSGLGAGQQQIDLSALGLSITPVGYALLGIVFFISIVATLALAVSFSVFSEDVRSAQTSMSYIYIIILIPTLLLMFMDLNTLSMPAQLLLYIIPFTHTIVATKGILMGNYSTVLINIVYLLAFTVIVLYVAAKLFTTEKVFTTRLTFKRKLFGRRG
ncbi:MAG: ABC transporter permease [Nitrososphaeria archaeon]